MTTTSDLSDTNPPASAPPSPYPTVQILQAAMAHRDSIRRSFESQRASLAEAIAAQKQAVTQAVVNTQGRGGGRGEDESASLAASAASASATHAADGAPDRLRDEFLDTLRTLIAEEVARAIRFRNPSA